jgi:hypothetical protein
LEDVMKDCAHERWYPAFAILAGCVIFALALINRLNFPSPWVDDATFYLPGLWWAEHLSLQPTILHAPRGIFWMPDGFTVFLGVVLSFFGHSIQVARATCECAVAAGVTLFSLGFRKLAGSPQMGAAATLWLLTPPVVFAANMVRMEAPVFLLIAIALWLHLNGRALAAGSLLFGGLLIHPALGLSALGYLVAAWIARPKIGLKRRSSVGEWVLFAVVAIGLLAETLRLLHHLDLFTAHMTFQYARKTGIPLAKKIVKPQGTILLVGIAATATLLWRRHRHPTLGKVRNVLPVVAIALGLIIFAVVGGEPMYDVYALSLGPALIFCLLCRDSYRVPTAVGRATVQPNSRDVRDRVVSA